MTTFATKTRLLLTGIAGLLVSSQVALAQDCTPKHTFATIEEGTLTVAVTTYVPHSYLDDSGNMKGIDGDIAAEFAKRECLKVKAVAVDPAAAIQYVLSGQADIATGDWYRTAERAKVMNLSAPLYTDQMAIYSKNGFADVGDLEDKQVGTVQGYLWVTDLKTMLGSKLRLYPNSSTCSRTCSPVASTWRWTAIRPASSLKRTVRSRTSRSRSLPPTTG